MAWFKKKTAYQKAFEDYSRAMEFVEQLWCDGRKPEAAAAFACAVRIRPEFCASAVFLHVIHDRKDFVDYINHEYLFPFPLKGD